MSFFDRSSIYGIYDEEACVNIRGRFIIDPDYVQRAMEVLTPGGGVTFLSVLLPTLWAKERNQYFSPQFTFYIRRAVSKIYF